MDNFSSRRAYKLLCTIKTMISYVPWLSNSYYDRRPVSSEKELGQLNSHQALTGSSKKGIQQATALEGFEDHVVQTLFLVVLFSAAERPKDSPPSNRT
jgi:hypothetical protein